MVVGVVRCCVICNYLLQPLINFNEISISFFPEARQVQRKFDPLLYSIESNCMQKRNTNTSIARILISLTGYHAVEHMQLLIFLLYF